MENKRTLIKSAGKTDVGRVRSSNQDSFLADAERGLFVVADGMGGHAGGEIASKLCVETIQQYVTDSPFLIQTKMTHPDSRIHLELARAINAASSRIYEKALEEPNLKGMGTTATALLLSPEFAYFAHVGDSRLYLLRQGFIYQLSYDHSLVSEQVRAGIISREEADMHHLRNVITRSVGYQEEEDVDSGFFPLEKNDVVLMCSDGLYGKINDRELSDMLQKSRTNCIDELIKLANQRGGDDNITAIILDLS